LDGALGLDGSNGSVYILWYYITSVHEAASHVFTMTRITLGVHSSRLENTVGDFSNESCSWYAFSAEITGAYDVSMKWIRG
jgi:hypothetical protein